MELATVVNNSGTQVFDWDGDPTGDTLPFGTCGQASLSFELKGMTCVEFTPEGSATSVIIENADILRDGDHQFTATYAA